VEKANVKDDCGDILQRLEYGSMVEVHEEQCADEQI
jgi:hypothetical protein